MEVEYYWGAKPHPAILALKNHLILKNVFKFLSIEDYKPCRLVCRLWKDVNEAEFKQKVRLCMNFHPKWMNLPNQFAKYPPPSDLNEFFRSCQMNYPFEAFKLSGNIPWSVSQLTELFANKGRFLRNVTFQNLTLKLNENFMVHRLTRMIQTYPLMDMINGLVNLKSIYITCNGYTSFSLSLEDLVRFEDIHIEKCTIEITKNIILAPKTLTLEDISFTCENVFVDLVVLNSFVDFSEMKVLRLKSNPSVREKITKLSTNLAVDVKIETVNLLYPDSKTWFDDDENLDTIFNFQGAIWEIDTLSLYGIPFTNQNNMKIKRLHIHNEVLCLSNLPGSLESLSISKLKGEFPEVQEEIYLPDVKYLRLHDDETAIEYILPKLIGPFEDLTELILGCNENNKLLKINVRSIPKTVRKIMFIQPKFEIVGRKYVDTLIVRNASKDFMKSISLNFIPKSHFILFVDQLTIEDGQILLEVLSKRPFRKLVFGMFDLKAINGLKEHENFPNFDFPSYTNSIPEFYSLINKNDDVIKCKSYKAIRKLLDKDKKEFQICITT